MELMPCEQSCHWKSTLTQHNAVLCYAVCDPRHSIMLSGSLSCHSHDVQLAILFCILFMFRLSLFVYLSVYSYLFACTCLWPINQFFFLSVFQIDNRQNISEKSWMWFTQTREAWKEEEAYIWWWWWWRRIWRFYRPVEFQWCGNPRRVDWVSSSRRQAKVFCPKKDKVWHLHAVSGFLNLWCISYNNYDWLVFILICMYKIYFLLGFADSLGIKLPFIRKTTGCMFVKF